MLSLADAERAALAHQPQLAQAHAAAVPGASFATSNSYSAGITIVGGLVFSQALTLFTTPVVYLTLDRFTRRKRRPLRAPEPGAAPA